MTFTTVTFGLFLAVVFCIYWGVGHRGAQNGILILASYAFYGWWDWRFCILMLGSSLLDFLAGVALDRPRAPRGRKWILAATITANLGLLGFFKYFNFFAEGLTAGVGRLGWALPPLAIQVVLPVGISFYTFQSMSYAIDVYRRVIPANRNLPEYLAYVSFFPQLVAGPIERATHLLPQFGRSRRFDYALAVDGGRQILWGFGKKMLLADNLAPIVEQAYGNVSMATGPELLAATIGFAVQIYCDFSAYSDIAIGTARLFGFQLMRNFAFPYFSQSLTEFWRRWHISLTTWFRDYVYFPLGGSRKGRTKWMANVMIVFFLSGLWHGAAWTFIGWGLFHGLAVLLEHAAGRKSLGSSDVPGDSGMIPRVPTMLRLSLTFFLVCIGWVLFRSGSLADAIAIYSKAGAALVQLETLFLISDPLASGPLGPALVPAVVAFFALEWLTRDKAYPLTMATWVWPLRWTVYVAGALSILLWGTYGNGQFIYFQF